MQKQYSESNCSDDKYSIYSKSGRKLYHRINNNIRVLNKSKLSNKSNNSIGSVALRRTQLSNDKIYSRQQQIIPINNSQVGLNFQSGLDLVSQKKSLPMTPLMSNQNYRQRGRDSPSQRSLRSDSQKSSRYRPNNTRKLNKNQIQKLLMLQGDKNFNHVQDFKQRESVIRQSRSHSRRQKQSMRNSRNKDDKYGDSSKLRSIQTIRSSQKSNIKMGSSKNIKDSLKYPMETQQSNQLKKLSRKYQKINNQPSKYIKDHEYVIMQGYDRKYNRKNPQNDWYEQQNRQKSRNLQKYKSQKYLSTNQSELASRASRKKRTYEMQSGYNNQKKRLQEYKQKNKYDNNNYRKDKHYQNSLQKYQQETWARNKHRKNIPIDRNLINQRLFMGQQNNSYRKNQQYMQPSNNSYSKQQRQYNKNYRSDQRSSILQMRSRHDRSHIRNIRIKQQKYSNLYGSHNLNDESLYEQSNMKNPRSRNKYKSPPQYQSPRNQKQKYQTNHEYYYYLNSNNGKYAPHLNSPQTQISQTFDSLMLSINSHVTSSSIGQSNGTKSIIDKINLHVGTLDMISDYALQFKKMYQQIQQWEELIFLSYKKYWVQRVKVLEYLKRFRKTKRHESQRMAPNGSKKLIDNKLMSTKNICSDMPVLSNNDDPFAQQSMITNPFNIPFCKISQEQVKKVSRSQQGLVLIQKLQKQTSNSYQTLQQMYNRIIQKSGQKINMLYCDNYSQDIYILMLQEIQQLIPNLQQFKLFEATKIRLGKIVKIGILILYLNGRIIKNISEIITFDDCQKIGTKKKIKTFTTYDLYYEVFEKLLAQ